MQPLISSTKAGSSPPVLRLGLIILSTEAQIAEDFIFCLPPSLLLFHHLCIHTHLNN